MQTTFDYIIVGAGSAGSVIANRLSANPGTQVALIEAGPDDRRFPTREFVNTPAGTMFLMTDPKYNWLYQYSGEERLGGRDIFCPRGHLLGGSSAINGTIYIRGNPRDYDRWAAQGCIGWSWQDVLPLFKKIENREAGANRFHGIGGELNVTRLRSPQRVSQAFVEAALEAGHPANNDFNAETQIGFGFFDLNQKNGERMSAARSFVHPVAGRPNLHILTDTLTRKVVLQNKRAIGIEVEYQGQVHALKATREIVLSAGAIGSPQLLMLSGIGSKEKLSPHGIPVQHELSGVGENLQDHQDVLIIYESPMTDTFGWSLRALPWMVASPFKFYFNRRGPWTSNTVESGGFFKSSPELQDPDLQLIIRPLRTDQPQRKIPIGHGFSVHISLLRPLSKGHIRLASANPRAKPVLSPNFLAQQEDVNRLVAGVREVRRIVGSMAISSYKGNEIQPGTGTTTQQDLEQFIHSCVATTFHPTSTCKMGIDDCAVVDPRLRLHGIEGLRVADASIMPDIISGNTNAPSIMIGQKCAEMMLEDAA